MVNTIWKEVFLIMCSHLKENARHSGRFPIMLRITDDYTLPTLCGAPHNVGNEESKLRGMDGNRRIGDGSSIMAGPFFVCGDSGESFRSLTDEEVTKYMARFAQPEDISPEEVEADMGFMIYPM